MRFGLIVLSCFWSLLVHGEEVKGVDYCHDDKVSKQWLDLLSDYPTDPIIIKLVGLREGLCLMIDRKQITHEQGTDIWEDERQRSINDRNKEQAKKMPEFTI